MSEKAVNREVRPFYIGPSDSEQSEMLKELGLKDKKELFNHISQDQLFHNEMGLPKHLSREELKHTLLSISKMNKTNLSFIGSGLQDFKVPTIAGKVAQIRGLTTAYTPYQPERSQGTLETLWIYQSLMSGVTGFEAINASMYDRSTCLFEAIKTAIRLVKNSDTVLVPESIYAGDKEVLETLTRGTETKIIFLKINKETGITDTTELKKILETENNIAALVVPQINTLGLIEDFDTLTNIAHEKNLLVISIIDPVSLSNNGLKEPSKWGDKEEGADILVGEGQHLALAPNLGGPGLGIFGIRYSEKNKNDIRQTAGRFIGKTVDEASNSAKSIILSTREQHIRREKATSNICSNQSFVASMCGASLLSKGDKGFDETFSVSNTNAAKAASELTKLGGVKLKFKKAFFNEILLELSVSSKELIKKGNAQGINIGVDRTGYFNLEGNLLLVSFSDKHTSQHLDKLISFFKAEFHERKSEDTIPTIRQGQKRITPFYFKNFKDDEIENYYKKLGEQNLSPDDGIYPLGSCTMKYNPEINDWAAGLSGFTSTHPEAPLTDMQGSLFVLYEIENWFKKMTGLDAVTTQPVAGAQGELVGLKLFQAYHHDHKDNERDIIIIPKSSHGTNPATAAVAGYKIVTLSALSNGMMDISHLEELIKKHDKKIAGIMVTNPNTSGIFEKDFKKMSDLIHSIGGLVYMDGANMNAIAGFVDLSKLGVDAVHNNLHKTWSIPHGGGGPGDAIVAVSKKLTPYLPGVQIIKEGENFITKKAPKSIGSFHRHFGNFAHKVRGLTYLYALGEEGIKEMSAVSVLSARYLYKKLKDDFKILPAGSEETPRMHEFILSFSDEAYDKINGSGTPKANATAKIGKLFLDFGFHAPTVAFPEVYGLMVEPTESFTKEELDHFCDVIKTISKIVHEYPEVLKTTPHFTPVLKVDELRANKDLILKDNEINLGEVIQDRVSASKLRNMDQSELISLILGEHQKREAHAN